MEYGLRKDGTLSVLNTCYQGSLDGPKEQAEGVARVVGVGKLRVTFVPWLSGLLGAGFAGLRHCRCRGAQGHDGVDIGAKATVGRG